MKFYRSTHFRIEELVPRETFRQLGGLAWILFDNRLLYTLDCLREYFDFPLIVNDWKWGGTNHFRGFRPSDCTVGVKYSQHRFGRAIDLKPGHNGINCTAEYMRLEIIANSKLFPHITSMEDGVSWLHFDIRNTNNDHIKLFKG